MNQVIEKSEVLPSIETTSSNRKEGVYFTNTDSSLKEANEITSNPRS
jgi:hypothetical protein